MKKPIFSVIIPTYNRASFLKIAINSVLRQTFMDYELLIIDDGSTDETKKIVKALQQNNLHYFHQPHNGVSAARNNGIAKSQGSFICFLDSDDRFLPQKLELTYKYIKKHSDYKIFHTEELWYRNGSRLTPKAHHKKPSGFAFENALRLCCVSISTATISREVFNAVGLFDENLPACEDYDFWLRATAKFPVFLIPKNLTIKEGGHLDQQSHKFHAMDQFRIYALEKLLKSDSLSKDNYKKAYKELENKCLIYIKGAQKRGKATHVKQYQNLLGQLRSPGIHE